MKITSDGNIIPKENIPSASQNTNNNGPSMSYASQTAQNKGAIARPVQRNIKPLTHFWTDQIRQIITRHNQGARVLILMRGAPGSGKSHLAKLLVESMVGPTFNNYTNHILSTDDYFMVRGQYQFDKLKLSFAHLWNQERVRLATDRGLSPIVVDNTNIEMWEMQPYVTYGVRNGYIIEVIEPTTPWAKKANQLFKKNSHNVPIATIKRMLENYVDGVTGSNLIRSFGLCYPASMVPPVRRLIPPVAKSNENTFTSKPVATVIATSGATIATTATVTTLDTSHVQVYTSIPVATITATSIDTVATTSIVTTPDTLQVQIQSSIPETTVTATSNSTIATTDTVTTLDTLHVQVLSSPEIEPCEQNIQEQQLTDSNLFIQAKEEKVEDQDIKQPESESLSEVLVDDVMPEQELLPNSFFDAQKKAEEFEKIAEEWENGEGWDENDNKTETVGLRNLIPITSNTTAVSEVTGTRTGNAKIPTSLLIKNMEAKPPRKEKNVADSSCSSGNGLMESVNNCQDWRDISLFMPPWDDPNKQPLLIPDPEVPIEKITSSTCVEIGDTDLLGKHKVIASSPRDINEFYVPPEREKIPEVRMLDKSTTTNEETVMSSNCPQKERHFINFRKLFHYIERDSLRYIFDNCCGDVNWAVENVLGGGVQYELKKLENGEESDLEEEMDSNSLLPCTCLAKYDIVPNMCKTDLLGTVPTETTEETPGSTSIPPQSERKKRELVISNESIQLKKQIEQNIVISDNHYSEHCRKIRKLRRGEVSKVDNISDQPSTSGTSSAVDVNMPACNSDTSDEDDCEGSDISDGDKIVNVNVGREFITDLDNLFGRKDMEYPQNIKFNISIPTSLLNEINALWMESMMFQLEQFANKSAEMVRQDEQFARQIAMKEEELLLEGKEPDVPDFKEIMDLELALSLHLKNVSEWRNNIPTDLAAKMTHEKLFHLFPEIKNDTLLEMLMAHDNNFETTVEVVLVSMGRHDVLEAENGIKKFVMAKELERQEKALEEQRKEISNNEWPLLPKGEKVEMATVQSYRDEAERHLTVRNLNIQKAEDFVRRGITPIANYYSDIANLHKTKYEYANSLAVAALMQYHANNNPDGETVDLHYLRVKEAKETMDIFIDTHIQKLRESSKRSIVLFFITGRGLHSPGRPKVKPACIKRLAERGLHHIECNPGLLRARVSCDDKLTYQIP